MKHELSSDAIEAFEELLTVSMDVGSFLDDGTDDAFAMRAPLLEELVSGGAVNIESGHVQIERRLRDQMLALLSSNGEG